MPVEFIGAIRTKPVSELNNVQNFLNENIIDQDYIRELTQAHEKGGFDRVLVAYRANNPDSFIVASYAASISEQLGFLIAHRPGFVAPTLAARTAATLDHFTNGRIAVHIITGGYDADQQRDGDLIAHEKKVMEKRLAPLGVDVQWSLFVSGPPLLEALDTGSIDLGPTGETPPIFAQAAGSKLVYLVNIPGLTAEAKAIIVPKDSSIRTLTDLKGKKVAFARGTALTYFLVKALEEVGLKLSDIKPVNLTCGFADKMKFEQRSYRGSRRRDSRIK
ncbi:LLM class flavin-dependent oxidoreductase [Nostoc sp.]|uniref:LLM class flavin-dependent oxidoreductase n=1 Tax=Nostoc sp. TaxID=1180 RepID=UPI002FF86C1C